MKRDNSLKKKINPTRVPIEEKESIRWLKNLEQSTALWGDPALGPYRRSGERDLRAFLQSAGDRSTVFVAHLRGPARRG